MIGPAFLDLQLITNTDVQQASALFTSLSAGNMAGSLLVGLLYDLFNPSLLLIGGMLMMAVTSAVTPFCSLFGVMVVVCFLTATFAQMFCVAATTEEVQTWGAKASETALQATNCAYAVGAVAAPLIVEPFLAPINEAAGISAANYSVLDPRIQFAGLSGVSDSFLDPRSQDVGNTSFYSIKTSSEVRLNGSFYSNDSVSMPSVPKTRIHFAFSITAALSFLASIPLLVDFITTRQAARNDKESLGCVKALAEKEHRASRNDYHKGRPNLPRTAYLGTLLWVCVFNAVFLAVEITFPYYLPTFVVLQLGWSKSRGALVTSAFWLAFAGSRFACMFLVRIFRPAQILVSCFSLMVPSFVAFLLASLWQLDWLVWLSSVTAGVATSAVVPSGFSWVNDELMPVTGRVTSVVLLAANVGPLLNPMVLGHMMENSGAICLAYELAGEATLCALIFLLLLLFSRTYLRTNYGSIHNDDVTQDLQPLLSVPESVQKG
ncbi:sodium-dependent glucose transporter 1-like [Littorina saxatilis]